MSALTELFAVAEPHSFRETTIHLAATTLLSLYAFQVIRWRSRISRLMLPMEAHWFFWQYSKALAILGVAIPTVLFVYVMRNAYVPAVFTMAIIAIVVAADHDAALEEVPEAIEMSLRRAENKIEQKAERLARLAENYTWYTEALQLNDIERFHAVVRHWEVPPEIYRALSSSGGNGTVGFDEACRGSSQYKALSQFRRYLVEQKNVQRTHARFICPSIIRLRPDLDSNAADLRYFTGLVFMLCCIYLEANDERCARDADTAALAARIRVGRAPIWCHAINDSVFQIIETTDPLLAISRPLHDELPKSDTSRQKIKEWANAYHTAIRTSYDLGGRAESFVASMILSQDAELLGQNGETITDVLNTQLTDVSKAMGAARPAYQDMVVRDFLHPYMLQENVSSPKEAVASLPQSADGFDKMLAGLLQYYLCLRARFLDLQVHGDKTSTAAWSELLKAEVSA